MPERSEWLVAGGAAKRNPRYRATNHNASERREYHFPPRLNSRLSLRLQSESDAVALLKKTDENYYNKRQILTFVVERKNRSVEEVNHAFF